MTEDRNDDSQKRIPEDAPTWTIPDHRDRTGVNRRTIITGAAWSIPVIALAVAPPLAAASAAAPTLEFTNGPYEVAGCAPLGEVILNLTTDGNTPDPGKIVTVVLPAGLTWSDGTSGAKVFTATDASGNISIPAGQINRHRLELLPRP
jgi:hypothetical protein